MPKIHSIKNYNIYLYYQDHQPPHIHIRYQNKAIAIMTIDGAIVMEGALPVKIDEEIRRWIISNHQYLLEVWERATKGEPIV